MNRHSSNANISGAGSGRRRREAWIAYALLAPSALILGAFGLAPLIGVLYLSLQDWRLAPGPFVGLQNYQKALMQDPEFWRSLGVTVWYVLGTVPATLIVGYLLAEVLSARIRGKSFYRLLFFVPYVVSPVAAAAVWKWILNPNFGVANAALAPFGFESRWLSEQTGIFRLLVGTLGLSCPDWLAGPSLALVCVIVVSIWHNLGFAVVVLLAGLSAIPADITEAARLDGASGWRLLRRVKIPLLSPTLFFLLILFTIRAFQTFTQIYILSPDHRGGPNDATRNITLYIVQSFYDFAARLGPGYGAALAVLLFIIILALTLLQFRLIGRTVHYH